MAWLGKVSLANFSDIAEAVTKLGESVKNIERNFDSALGFEAKPIAHEVTMTEQPFASESDMRKPSLLTADLVSDLSTTSSNADQERIVSSEIVELPSGSSLRDEPRRLPTENGAERIEQHLKYEETMSTVQNQEDSASVEKTVNYISADSAVSDDESVALRDGTIEVQSMPHFYAVTNEVQITQEFKETVANQYALDSASGDTTSKPVAEDNNEISVSNEVPPLPCDLVEGQPHQRKISSSDSDASSTENLRGEVKMLEAALQGAAKQAQVKADEISRLLVENEKLKAALEEQKNKSTDAQLQALKEEYKERLGAAEQKVYALTKERDMLRREQNRKIDLSTLLKEKDEIIKQVMAEGEELSKKQAAQEAQMRKLRAQIRELEEEKQRLNSKLQVEEAKVDSLKKDKAVTERALQDTVERSQAELATQKEFYIRALNDAREAEAKAEARAESETKLDLERRLHEAEDREGALVRAVEELRQALSRTEQQASFREDMLRRDIEDLEKRCQAAELRYEELVARVPESTRPLLRQIEAMQESTAMRAEAWTGVERTLNARLQEAEVNAAAAQERERATNERLTHTLSRMAVLEAQISCLKAEVAQFTRSLEKERQRASENRQEYLAALEAAATHEGRARQFEEELKELQSRHKRELAEERALRELLEKEVEHARKARIENERQYAAENWVGVDNVSTSQANSQNDYGSARSLKRFSSVSSAGSVEESYFLQASLDLHDDLAGDRVSASNAVSIPYTGKSMVPAATLDQLQALLRQKEGELALYASRLASLESTRDSLAEELVKTTTMSEKLRAEVASIPGLCAELDALRRRHTSALELMGERDEEVEELKADIADLKEMYREQINMLVSQIEKLSTSMRTN